jgi:hypothetical protein
MSYNVIAPYPQFFDPADGLPLNNGTLFIGVANANPEGSPITAYWDAAATQPAAQPIPIVNGYPSRNGTAANVYVNSDYSMTVKNKNGLIVLSNPITNTFASTLAASTGASLVGWIYAAASAVASTVQNWISWQSVNVFGFMTVAQIADVRAGTLSLNVASAVSAAITYANTLSGCGIRFPRGAYRIDSVLPQITVPVVIDGEAGGISSPTIGTRLSFAATVPGFSLGNAAQNSKINNIYLKSASTVLGTDDGITSLAHATQLQNVVCDGFGRHGFNFDTSAGGNCNNSVLIATRAVNNKSHGHNLVGNNSNAFTFISPDSTLNAGYGFNLDGCATNTLITPHADSNTTGDYRDNGSGNHYYNVYSEAHGIFLLDTASNYAYIDASYFAYPVVTNNSSIPSSNIFFSQGTQTYLGVGGSVAGGFASQTFAVDPTGNSGNGIVFIGKGGSQVNRVVAGVLTFDFGSVAAQGQLTTTFTLTGAKVGSPCHISTSQAQTAGLLLRADCFTTGVITITIANITAGAIDPANVSYRVAQIVMVA